MSNKQNNKFQRQGYVEKPRFIGPLDEVIVVQTNEWAITNFGNKKPIIGIPGYQKCLVIVGYEPKKREGFGVHLSGKGDEQQALRDLERELCEENNYQLRISGGEDAYQRDRVNELIRLFSRSKLINGYFVEKDLYGINDPGFFRTLAIDTRNGKLYSFFGMVPLRPDPWTHPEDILDEDIKDPVIRVK